MKIALEVYADEISTPLRAGGFARYRPGKLSLSAHGKILEVSESSFSKTKTLKTSRRRIRKKVIIPGLVDAHTHLVFAGDRADEWNRRLQGASYQQIAAEGGGIKKTVCETQNATPALLLKLAKDRLRFSLSKGVTTIEIKSGYGLTFEVELKILKVIRDLKRLVPQDIIATFMGAHTTLAGRSTSETIEDLIQNFLPKLKGLAEFQDVFCEENYFSESESVRLLEAGKKFGLKPKIHAHEFGRTGGVRAACKVGAVSAEHLMECHDEDILNLKASGVVPVLLPGTSFFLGAKKFAPAKRMWDAGLQVAIASDFNPGTNPSLDLPLSGVFAAIHQGLNLEQVLTAQTFHAALALARFDRGCLQKGQRADFVCLDSKSFEGLYYAYGLNTVESIYVSGTKV